MERLLPGNSEILHLLTIITVQVKRSFLIQMMKGGMSQFDLSNVAQVIESLTIGGEIFIFIV